MCYPLQFIRNHRKNDTIRQPIKCIPLFINISININYLWLKMNIRSMLICLLLIAIVASKKEIWIRYEIYQQESRTLEKYFHGMNDGYFVDLGGFNPVQYSNTVKFSNWNGIIVEANQKRSTNIRDFQPHVTSLNFAVSNVSGEMATFYEADFAQASSLSKQALNGKPFKQQKAMVITMADLCHKYYKAKPNLLNIDIEGIGEIVLQANDWSTDKCIPDIIFAEDDQPNEFAGFMNLTQVVTSHNYTKVARVKPSTLFIHNSKLQFYRKQAENNQQQMSNKVMYTWNQLCQVFQLFLGKKYYQEFSASNNTAYPYFRQLNVIDIVQINKFSNLVSKIGPNRPIIIMQYDQKVSKIYLGTNKYIIQQVEANSFHFKKITADYNGNTLEVYVFDHQKYNKLSVDILEYVSSPAEITNNYDKIIDEFKSFLVVSICLIITFVAAAIWAIQKRKASKNNHHSHSPIKTTQAETKPFVDNQI